MRIIINATTEKEFDIAHRVARRVWNERPEVDWYFGTFKNLEGAADFSEPEIASTCVHQTKTGYTIKTTEGIHNGIEC